jgi:dTDP-4-dehydrorhamnose reductase
MLQIMTVSLSDNMPGDAEIAEVWANVRGAGYGPGTFSDMQRCSMYACAVGFFEQTIRNLASNLQAKQKKEPEDYQTAVNAWRQVALEYKTEADELRRQLRSIRDLLSDPL